MNSFDARDAAAGGAEAWRVAEEEVLARAREVGRRITERVRVVTGDTDAHATLTDETAERRPVR
jgi:hypothetical protein